MSVAAGPCCLWSACRVLCVAVLFWTAAGQHGSNGRLSAAASLSAPPFLVADTAGSNTNSQLGDGSMQDSTLPVLVVGNHTFTALSAGGAHTCGLGTDGTLCWG